ncbi:MAG: cupin domain-containing protein [Gammaproteobacteria bacterium]|nr:cupin domain-containing protein [Gammaproteobacteria bacterium]
MNIETRLNMDFEKVACILSSDHQWEKSPADGVSRIPLEREAEEHGHTTSIVKFDPDSFFPPHSHPQGEEVYVLEGVFSDEHGDYPAGTYIRNPPGSHHKPFTREGCTLFVKLDQFQADDDKHIVIKPEDQEWRPGIGNLQVIALHTHNCESTALVFWPKNEVFQPHTHWGGEEVFVIKGQFIDEYGSYPAGSWIRSPHLSKHYPRVEEETIILVKVGHLTDI